MITIRDQSPLKYLDHQVEIDGLSEVWKSLARLGRIRDRTRRKRDDLGAWVGPETTHGAALSYCLGHGQER